MAYVYAISVDGVLRYVGKGTGNRAWVHLTGARRGNARVGTAVKRGQSVKVEIVREGLTDAEAFALEEQIISEVGREDNGTGSLWNLSAGGLGGTGEGAKKRWADPAYRKRAVAAFSKAQRGSRKNKEHLAALASDPGVRQKRAEKMTERQWKPMVEATRRRRENPEWMKSFREVMKAAHNRPEVIETKRRAAIKALADPELRKLIGERVRAAWARRKADPVAREQISLIARENARRRK